MQQTIRVTVWNEYLHEIRHESIRAIYPEGIHGCIAGFLNKAGMKAGTATLREEEHGLRQEVLDNTDVLIWWGHMAHQEVQDEIVERVYRRVMQGMGLIALHSAHASKIFRKLCGTDSDQLRWREANEKEILWVMDPAHPIAQGLPDHFILPHEEMYGETFVIPRPDDLVFVSWFEGGEVFRSGVTYTRGLGKVFYFRPGHETFPTFYNPHVQQVIINAVRWAAPYATMPKVSLGHNPEPIMPLSDRRPNTLGQLMEDYGK
ncbi:MAG TPA: ThuA domain-containing protein [Clostridia bacterium]|jgi:trehalose utilization protein|nr:ThuA domain-containing protein [Clostridia bacterium]HPY44152.1 ThuA domain-containing protein [Clostridia bacterium]HQA97456.1 ThuA domain-containing protein [Clostridia bacterium]HQO56820.1 ThuA domain-containing protein [Clostridia bacterium]HUM60796.1 ThuA domain-containing protein [Clostridia bacterium]